MAERRPVVIAADGKTHEVMPAMDTLPTSPQTVRVIGIGEVFNASTAPAGKYFWGEGSIISGAPTSTQDLLYTAFLEVSEGGYLRELTVIGKRTGEASGFNHVTKYVHWVTALNSRIWSIVGPGTSANPAATASFTMQPLPN